MTGEKTSVVLITGVSGFLATHVLDATLASPENYKVKGTLRSTSKSDAILSRLSPSDRSRVTLIEVKDTASSDLTEAFKDVDYCLHVASPYQLNVEDAKRDLLIPAVEGTLNVLRFAKKQGNVKRIGITSSFAAVTDFTKGGPNRPGFTYTSSDWNPSTEEDAIKVGGAGAFSYSVSKKLAEKAAYDFVEKEKPSFKIATFNPPMIYGSTEQPGVRKSNLNTSSNTIYNLISNASQMPEDRLPLFCSEYLSCPTLSQSKSKLSFRKLISNTSILPNLRFFLSDASDVAAAHVRYLSAPSSADSIRYLLCGGSFTWAHAVSHISTKHQDLISRLPKGWEEATKTIKNKGPGKFSKLDTSEAENRLSLKFKGWEETLEESLQSLLELEKSQDW